MTALKAKRDSAKGPAKLILTKLFQGIITKLKESKDKVLAKIQEAGGPAEALKKLKAALPNLTGEKKEGAEMVIANLERHLAKK